MRPSPPLLIPGHTLLRAELLRIVRAGINSSLESPPSRLLFMAWGLGPFCTKLPQEDCQVGAPRGECVHISVDMYRLRRAVRQDWAK